MLLLGLLLGTIGTTVGMWWRGAAYRGTYGEEQAFDRNDDGRPDEWLKEVSAQVTFMAYDRNHDGKRDAFLRYRDGMIEHSESDDNFDGQIDTWMDYSFGILVLASYDSDSNGVPDLTMKYKHGVEDIAIWWPNEAGSRKRIIEYSGGFKKREYVEFEGVPVPDSTIEFDAFENPLRLPEESNRNETDLGRDN